MKYIIILITSFLLAVVTYKMENHYETNGNVFTWIISFIAILVFIITALISRGKRKKNYLGIHDNILPIVDIIVDVAVDSTINAVGSVVENLDIDL